MPPRSAGIKNNTRAILAVVVFGVCANHPAGVKNNTRAILVAVCVVCLESLWSTGIIFNTRKQIS